MVQARSEGARVTTSSDDDLNRTPTRQDRTAGPTRRVLDFLRGFETWKERETIETSTSQDLDFRPG